MANVPGDGPIRRPSSASKKTTPTSKAPASKTAAVSKKPAVKAKTASKPRADLTTTTKALSSGTKSKTRNRTDSRDLTGQQADTASSLTGAPSKKGRSSKSIDPALLRRLPEEDRRAVLASKKDEDNNPEVRPSTLLRLGEEDRQAIKDAQTQRAATEATERITAAETPQERVELLSQELERPGADTEAILKAAGPEVIAQLEEADSAVVSQTLTDLSEIVGDDEQAARIVASQLQEHPPENFQGVVSGLATGSAAGNSQLASAYAEELKEANSPAAGPIEQAAALGDAVREINQTVKPDDLGSALTATDRITSAINGAPPEIAQALLTQLDSDGSLDRIAGNLGEQAKNTDAPGTYYPSGTDLLAPVTDGRSISSREQFDRIVTGLSNAVSVADNEANTAAVGSRIANVIGDDIGRFDEAFELAVGQGRGAGLVADVATRVHAKGETHSSANLVEGIERGADTFLKNFDSVADKVDTSNADLSYLLAEWGPFYGDSEEGQKALQDQIAAFQEGRPEYERLNQLSTNVGRDLEALRDLQDLFPEKATSERSRARPP